ncbi:hypothetical protein JJJ17_05410 [Paracoccus caeni]|uniref:Uncharacterized protein n=1 Tax=Paracoccus caeni TaxID=657651 RepID=A0A934SAH9_9RHOB|nr:hypothetical protein [Paracoccus caeni]MBK4215360.1 hypothetical protein [Paracoccus caeni]
MNPRLPLTGLAFLAAAVAVAFFIRSAADEPQDTEYNWGQIVSAEALSSHLDEVTSEIPTPPIQICRFRLQYLDDPRLLDARLLIILDFFDHSGWLAYDGPVAPEIDLDFPGEGPEDLVEARILVNAIARDDLHLVTWNSYRTYRFGCSAKPRTIRLLQDFDMDGTRGNLHLID